MYFNTIVVATDLSKTSTNSFEVAALEAKLSGTRIYLLHVIQSNDLYSNLYTGDAKALLSNWISKHVDNVEKTLNKFVKDYFHGQEVETEMRLTSAHVGNEISNFAKEVGANAIFISRTGKGLFENILFGDSVEKVLKAANCPVVVFPIKTN